MDEENDDAGVPKQIERIPRTLGRAQINADVLEEDK
jgi:hypothetical protein